MSAGSAKSANICFSTSSGTLPRRSITAYTFASRSGGTPAPASSAANSDRLLTRTSTSSDVRPTSVSESTATLMTSASASTSSLPTTSMFHWKNSRSRPRWGRS